MLLFAFTQIPLCWNCLSSSISQSLPVNATYFGMWWRRKPLRESVTSLSLGFQQAKSKGGGTQVPTCLWALLPAVCWGASGCPECVSPLSTDRGLAMLCSWLLLQEPNAQGQWKQNCFKSHVNILGVFSVNAGALKWWKHVSKVLWSSVFAAM